MLLQYSDDTAVFSYGRSFALAKIRLQKCLEKIHQWLGNLENVTKTLKMLFFHDEIRWQLWKSTERSRLCWRNQITIRKSIKDIEVRYAGERCFRIDRNEALKALKKWTKLLKIVKDQLISNIQTLL